MAITLAEWAKGAPDDMDKGIISSWLEHTPFLEVMTVDGIDGFESEWLIEQQLPTVGFRSLNEAFTESTGKTEKRRTGIGIMGGLIDIERRFLRARNRIDQAALQLDMKTRAMGYKLADTIINGSLATDPESFDGLLRAVTEMNTRNSRQVIDAAGLDLTSGAAREANAGQLRYYIQQAMTRVESLCGGKPTFMLMSETMKLALVDTVASSGMYRTDRDSYDRDIDAWAGVRIYHAGWSDPTTATEIIGDTFDGDGYTSIFFVKVGAEYTSLIQQGGLEKVHIGPTENGVHDRWLVEHAVGLRVKDNGSCVRLRGLDLTA